jgi:uncharacterized protein YjdB
MRTSLLSRVAILVSAPVVIASLALVASPATAAGSPATTSVYGFGRNLSQQLCGFGNGSLKAPIASLGLVKGAAGGTGFTLYLLSDGSVRGCGADDVSQLGDGDSVSYKTTPVNPGLTSIKQVAAGFDTGYALSTTGVVYSWGSNHFGQTGHGTISPVNGPPDPFPTPITTLTGHTITAISAGGLFAMALEDNGAVWTWGSNGSGQLGRVLGGGATASGTPAVIPTPWATETVASIAAGHGTGTNFAGDHAAVATDAGNVYLWGENEYGQLGQNVIGAHVDIPTPTQVGFDFGDAGGGDPIVSVAAGGENTFAIGLSGNAYSWGQDLNGSRGSLRCGSCEADAPTQMDGMSNVLSIAARGAIGIALLEGVNNSVAIWGSPIPFGVSMPTPVEQKTPVAATAVGASIGDTLFAIAKNPTSVEGTVSTSTPKGRATQLALTANYSDGTTADAKCMATWSSDNTATAAVDSCGKALGVNQGSTQIHANVAAGALSANTSITVTDPVPDHLSITPNEYTSAPGYSGTYRAKVVLTDGGTRAPTGSILWTSSAPTIASVNASTGVAQTLDYGDTVIGATAEGVSGEANLHVAHVSSITVLPPNANMLAGEQRAYGARAHFDNGRTRFVVPTWSSTAPAVATVGARGQVTGVAPGTSNIQAAYGGVTGSTPVHVTTVSSVTVTPATAKMARNTSRQMTAVAHFANGGQRNVTATASWQSLTPAVASVSTTGLVSGLTVGQSTIQATFGGVTGSALAKVLATTSVAVTPASDAIDNGDTTQLTAIATLSDLSTQNVTSFATWLSADLTLATVSSTGLVLANDNGDFGNVNITATLNSQSDFSTITINDPCGGDC